MAFQVNSNLGALTAYEALKKSNAEGLQAQLRLATRKRINNVSDDVSGFNVGKSLESKIKMMQSSQSNIASAKNMLGTAESALLLVKDKVTQIKQYIADASDPTKDRKALAENIKSLGEEIKNIFETTKFNDTQLLIGKSAGMSLASIESGTITLSDTKMSAQTITSIANSFTFQTGASVTDRITLDFASGLGSAGDAGDKISSTSATIGEDRATSGASKAVFNAINSFISSSATLGGLGKLLDDDETTQAEFGAAIASLGNAKVEDSIILKDQSTIDQFSAAIDEALGKIGNFVQRLDVKDDYLTSAISNASATVSRLFDADMAMEQLNATKSSLSSNIATNMLGQLNMAPQQILSLFQ